MAKKTTTNPKKNSSSDIKGLRSVNLNLDFDSLNRLDGYVPTNKALNLSAEVMSSLMGRNENRAFAVSAPYGSGKSSIALFLCQLLEFGSKKSQSLKNLIDAAKKKKSLEKNENIFSKWENSGQRGLAIPLVGYDGGSISGLVLDGIHSALQRKNLPLIANKIKKLPRTIEGLRQGIDFVRSESGKFDSVFIVWDEFGKVLEQVVAEGNGKALLEIQILAEISARTTQGMPVVFCIVLHQSFARYSSSLPVYVRNEWAKIEGRFKQINYIEDSKEIYELISQVISRKYGKPEVDRAVFKKMAGICHKVGIFNEFDADALTEVLWSSAPLSPVSLYLLPKVSARVAQNERTMFSYLWSNETTALPATSKKWVTPADLFDFFKDLMRVDTSIGGTHKLWVEAQSALKKTDDDLEIEIVKALSCIKVGASAGALAGTAEVLDLSLGNANIKTSVTILTALKALEVRKAIFLKRLNGEYSVWQGSDVDIRGALQETISKLSENFEADQVMTKAFPAPFRFPQRYNDLNCIRRYFDGRYVQPSEIDINLAPPTLENDPILDGRIFYVLAESVEEILHAKEKAKELSTKQIIFAIPRRPLLIREGLTEVEAYHHLLNDPDFSKQDPIIEQELRQLLDDSEQHFKTLASKLTEPSFDGPMFYWNGKQIDDVNSPGDLKRLLSKICDNVFPKTPIINNEMVNKSDPSSQIVNARKNIIRGIFDNYGNSQLGLQGHGPDVSIFRALFLKTNLYKEWKEEAWRFSKNPENLSSSGLADIWNLGLDFWTETSDVSKDLKKLFTTWGNPPYGMRKGLYPLILAATFKTAGGQAQIFEDGVFVTDYKPELFEKMVKSPQSFMILVPELDTEFLNFLDDVTTIFSNSKNTRPQSDKVRQAAHSLIGWLKSLPQIAIEQGMVSKKVDEFLLTVRLAKEPTKLFTEGIKKVSEKPSYPETSEWLREIKKQLESVESNYFNKTRTALINGIITEKKENITKTYLSWVKNLPGIDQPELRNRYLSDKRAAGFITRIEQGYPSDSLFVMSMAELLSEKPLKFWNSGSFSRFKVSLVQTIRLIEEMAEEIEFESWSNLSVTDKNDHSGRWIEKKMRGQFERVVKRLGRKEAREFVEKVLDSVGDSP